MRMRWKALRERISHTDDAMEAVGKLFAKAEGTPSDGDSLSQMTTPNHRTTSSRTSTLGRSHSPSGELAGNKSLVTPAYSAPRGHLGERYVGSETNAIRRLSLMSFKDAQSSAVSSSSQSSLPSLEGSDLVSAIQRPEWSTSSQRLLNADSPAGAIIKQAMPSPGRLASSPAWPLMTPRSASRMSQSSPSVSRIPVPQSEPRVDPYRSHSRLSQARSDLGSVILRARSASPIHIPAPRLSRSASASVISDDEEPPTSLMQRAVTPATVSLTSSGSPFASQQVKNRRQSFLPVAKGEQRAPLTSLTQPVRLGVNDTTLHCSEAVTPARPPRNTARPKPAPSSYNQSLHSSRVASRPPSRLRDHTATLDPGCGINQTHGYVAGNPKDPLDLEVAAIVNSIPHGFCVERIDPHLRRQPPPGEEIKAQYSFTNALGRKVVTCKLLIIQRSTPKTLAGHVPTRKVMCRVGGGMCH